MTIIKITSLMLVLMLAGCAGTRSFNQTVRAGDTVALGVGWRQNLSKSNITVEITPVPTGVPVVYGPNDPAIRAVFNLYPDPLSGLLVSPRVGEDLTFAAQQYASLVETLYTGPDNDWSETVVFVDLPLPANLPVGRARIQVSGGGYDDPPASIVEIVDGVGRPQDFSTEGGGLTANQLAALERVDNYVVSFSGSTIPYAVQIDLTHDPDRDSGGVGKAYVVNTRGDIKNVAWNDDGLNLRVLLTSANNQPLSDLLDFKFYLAGGITGLSAPVVQAYDINGNVIAGVSASVMVNP